MPMASYASNGTPMSATHTSPAYSGPSADNRPCLGSPSVTVTAARTQAPATRPLSASSPEGTSTDTTRRPDPFMALIQPATRPIGGRDRPVPSRASTTSWASPNSGSAAISTPWAFNAFASSNAGPDNALASMQATPASRP